MDIDKLAKEAIVRINKHIEKLTKKHVRQMKKQFDKKK